MVGEGGGGAERKLRFMNEGRDGKGQCGWVQPKELMMMMMMMAERCRQSQEEEEEERTFC